MSEELIIAHTEDGRPIRVPYDAYEMAYGTWAVAAHVGEIPEPETDDE